MIPIVYYFTASFYTARLAAYFNRVLIASQLSDTQDMDLLKLRQLWIEELRTVSPYFGQMLQQSQGIYQHFFSKLPSLQTPQDANEYFDWSHNYLNNIGSTLQLGQANESVYSYGFHLGNIYSNLEILNWALALDSIGSNKNLSQKAQIENILEELRTTQFKWSAAAINLGNFPAFKTLWEIWRQLQKEVEAIEKLQYSPAEDKYAQMSKLIMPTIEAIENQGKVIFEILQKAI